MRRLNDVPKIARLKRDAHKGDRGRVLVVAGSVGMSGAARLAGWGALRGGAGLVTIAVPETIHSLVAAELPCAMTLPLPVKRSGLGVAAGNVARAFADEVDVVAVGPGLTPDVVAFLRRLLRDLDKPHVLDADALNMVAADNALLASATGVRVMTPHPGEAARLLGEDVPGSDQGRIHAAAALADRYQAVVALKGAGSVVCDGDRYFVCRAGNPGMATGGSGDVLTGVIAARLAQEPKPFRATVQAVHAHARAGDLAAAALGEQGVIATDIVANIPAALSEGTSSTASRPRVQTEKGGGSRRRSGRAR